MHVNEITDDILPFYEYHESINNITANSSHVGIFNFPFVTRRDTYNQNIDRKNDAQWLLIIQNISSWS